MHICYDVKVSQLQFILQYNLSRKLIIKSILCYANPAFLLEQQSLKDRLKNLQTQRDELTNETEEQNRSEGKKTCDVNCKLPESKLRNRESEKPEREREKDNRKKLIKKASF